LGNSEWRRNSNKLYTFDIKMLVGFIGIARPGSDYPGYIRKPCGQPLHDIQAECDKMFVRE